MAERSGKGVLLAAVLWIIILGVLAVAGKFLILPYFQKELVEETGSQSRYKNEVIIAADSFSGYSILRSPVMAKELKSQGIKLTVQDDQADYDARMKALKDEEIQMAVFTVDSFLTSGVNLGSFPASIVMVIDETKGADAIVSYKGAVGNLNDLDSSDARLVLTPNSPSEFLARTVIAHFSLPGLPEKWWVEADGAEDVYQKFLSADKSSKMAYVLWEPYVTRCLEEKDAHVLLDSSKLKGYIVDVLVAERNFLQEHPELVKSILETYMRTAYSYSRKTDGMAELVKADAKLTGSEALSQEHAEKIVTGIEWKNTLENYAYFGLLPDNDSEGAQHIEDIILNISDVLVKTGVLNDKSGIGEASNLFYDKLLRDLKLASFHPGKKVNVIEGLGLGAEDLEAVRKESALKPLTDDEWSKLVDVAKLRVKPINFARGTSRINIQSKRDLNQLARNLESWPQYYLRVVGHARAEGDAEANMKLARDRAAMATQSLVSAGVNPNRINSSAAAPKNTGGSAQSVTFTLVQLPY